MSLINCRECKQSVSSTAKVCPNCGIKSPHKSSRIADRILLILVASGIVYWIVSPSAPPSADTQKQLAIIKAQEYVKKSLKDPDSAKFEKSTLYSSGAVCGIVNAKNNMGGYAGVERFIVIGTLVEIGSSENKGFDKLWKKSCHN